MIRKLGKYIHAVGVFLLLLLVGCGTIDKENTLSSDETIISSGITPEPTISPLTALPTNNKKKDESETISDVNLALVPTLSSSFNPTNVPEYTDDLADNEIYEYDDSEYNENEVLESLGINPDDPLWVNTDEGEAYRYNTLAEFFDLSIEDTKILVEAYYWLYGDYFNAYWYNAQTEETTISEWVKAVGEAFKCASYEEALQFIVKGYSEGTLDVEALVDAENYEDDELDTDEHEDMSDYSISDDEE